jgi:uncharacterized protein YbjT (DUF2867 family)
MESSFERAPRPDRRPRSGVGRKSGFERSRRPRLNILVTGITGFVGSSLAPRLARDGHLVRGFSRHPGGHAMPTPPGIPVVAGDAVSGAGLADALRDIDVAYFLIHSMEPVAPTASPDGAFGARERAAAENFAREAHAAGVRRVIYLGGLVPVGGPVSAHLSSRLAVEEILLGSCPCSAAFRASIVIGARSRSFRFLVKLIERLPVLAVPAWSTHRTNPIDERDVIEILARSATADGVCGQSLDLGGPDTVTYGELIDRIRDHMLLDRPTITFSRLTVTPIASRISALIAGESHELIGPLMESLDQDLLPRDNRAAELLGVRLHSLDSAIEHALAQWEASEELASR